MSEPAPAAATEDRLLDGQLVLRQPRDGFRVAIDSVLLAAAVPAAPGELVLEPGAGTGAAALCLARRVAGVRVVGLERQADLVRLAGENVRANGLAGSVDVMIGDLVRPPPRVVPASFAHVMFNPPYLPEGRGRAPADAGRAQAHVEGEAALAAWIDFALRMVRPKGTMTMIHRADRLDDILAHLYGKAGEIVVFPLWPGRDRPAKRVIVQARRGVATPLRLAPGLVLHEADGGYTPAADAVLRGAALAA
ncbi:MAG: tRNA1(Val) (adenine(37)-N6)-methyltransferase [Rhodospirillaceae bacterium]